jgi:hypothetical protein
MTNIALIGDSIFDNKAYVGSEPDVISHLKTLLPDDWKATLNAVDGNMVEHIFNQLLDIPQDATHLFISVGGNNAIMNADLLGLKVDSSAEIFDTLSNRVNDFENQYSDMMKTVLQKKLPTAVCTIYYPNFPEAFMQKISVAALSAFNDVIIRQAVLAGVPILDLRLVCNHADDYANEIEPSNKGGKKIASKIFEIVENHNFLSNQTIIYF